MESGLVLLESVEEEVERLERSSLLEALCGNSITLSSGYKVMMVMMVMTV